MIEAIYKSNNNKLKNLEFVLWIRDIGPSAHLQASMNCRNDTKDCPERSSWHEKGSGQNCPRKMTVTQFVTSIEKFSYFVLSVEFTRLFQNKCDN